MQKLAGGNGELDVARAAAKLRLNMTLSSQSTTSLEDVMGGFRENASDSNLRPGIWFQLYMTPNMSLNAEMIRRAEGKEMITSLPP